MVQVSLAAENIPRYESFKILLRKSHNSAAILSLPLSLIKIPRRDLFFYLQDKQFLVFRRSLVWLFRNFFFIPLPFSYKSKDRKSVFPVEKYSNFSVTSFEKSKSTTKLHEIGKWRKDKFLRARKGMPTKEKKRKESKTKGSRRSSQFAAAGNDRGGKNNGGCSVINFPERGVRIFYARGFSFSPLNFRRIPLYIFS